MRTSTLKYQDRRCLALCGHFLLFEQSQTKNINNMKTISIILMAAALSLASVPAHAHLGGLLNKAKSSVNKVKNDVNKVKKDVEDVSKRVNGIRLSSDRSDVRVE